MAEKTVVQTFTLALRRETGRVRGVDFFLTTPPTFPGFQIDTFRGRFEFEGYHPILAPGPISAFFNVTSSEAKAPETKQIMFSLLSEARYGP